MSTEKVKTEGVKVPELLVSMLFMVENPNITFYNFNFFFDGLVKNPPKNFLVENVKQEWFDQGKSLAKFLPDENAEIIKLPKTGFGTHSAYSATAAVAATLHHKGLKLEHLETLSLTLAHFINQKWGFINARGKQKMFAEYNRVYPNHQVTEDKFDAACILYAEINKLPQNKDTIGDAEMVKDCKTLTSQRKQIVKVSTRRFVQQIARGQLVFARIKNLNFIVDCIRAIEYTKAVT